MVTYSTSIEGDDNVSFVISTRENDASYMKVYIGLSKNLEEVIDEGENMSSDETYYVYFGYHIEANDKTDEVSYAYDNTSEYFNDLLKASIDAMHKANDAESEEDVYQEIAKGVEQMIKICGGKAPHAPLPELHVSINDDWYEGFGIGVHPPSLASIWNYN